ncbi:MAG: hypothetical protein CL859_04295 [Cyanobium sp. ARS6]|nr:hypothetical protein [Cyanobium sp. ARS6]
MIVASEAINCGERLRYTYLQGLAVVTVTRMSTHGISSVDMRAACSFVGGKIHMPLALHTPVEAQHCRACGCVQFLVIRFDALWRYNIQVLLECSKNIFACAIAATVSLLQSSQIGAKVVLYCKVTSNNPDPSFL